MKVICNSIGKCDLCPGCGAAVPHDDCTCEPCPIVTDAHCNPVHYPTPAVIVDQMLGRLNRNSQTNKIEIIPLSKEEEINAHLGLVHYMEISMLKEMGIPADRMGEPEPRQFRGYSPELMAGGGMDIYVPDHFIFGFGYDPYGYNVPKQVIKRSFFIRMDRFRNRKYRFNRKSKFLLTTSTTNYEQQKQQQKQARITK